MEVQLLNILSSYGDIGVLLMFLFWKSKQMEKKHEEAIKKLDAMSMTSSNIEKQLAIFSVKLDHGDERFVKIESDIKQLRESDHALRDNVHSIRNRMMTKDMVELMIDASKKDKE